MIFRWAQCFQRNLFCHFLTNYNIIYNKIIFDIIMSSCLLDAMVLGISCDDSRIFSKSGFISIPSSTSKILFLTLENHNSLVFSYFSSSCLPQNCQLHSLRLYPIFLCGSETFVFPIFQKPQVVT